MGIRNVHITPPVKFTPSPTKQIKFTDKTLALNRKQRRANKIYNRDLLPINDKAR
jgi:hypothetical protein